MHFVFSPPTRPTRGDYQHPRLPDRDGSERLSNLLKGTQLLDDGCESGFDSVLLTLYFGAPTWQFRFGLSFLNNVMLNPL